MPVFFLTRGMRVFRLTESSGAEPAPKTAEAAVVPGRPVGL